MATANSTRAKSRATDFPLWRHSASQQWCKKIRGRVYYFGTDQREALDQYLDVRDDLLAGRTPRVDTDELTVAQLCNRFLEHKEHLVESRELSPRTFSDYFREAERLTKVLGRDRVVKTLQPRDFLEVRRAITRSRGNRGTKDSIIRVRTIFKYAFEEDLIESPMKYGQSFAIPSKQRLRIEKSSRPSRILTAEEIRQLIAAAPPYLEAAIWLGVNAGFGNHDVGTLEQHHVDFDQRWMTFPRPKTGIMRECPLWDETAEALQAALEKRPAPAMARHGRRFLLTSNGIPYARDKGDPLGLAFRRLLKRLKLKREGLGLYSIRHSFLTAAENGCNDAPAIRKIMGHSDPATDMASHYRERIDPDRLRAVTDCVYQWLMEGVQ